MTRKSTGKPPAFQWYATDWLSDGKIALWTLAAKGAFVDLLCVQWKEGSIPEDPVQLAKLLRVDGRTFAPIWRQISDRFSRESPEKLANIRLEDSRKKMISYAESRSNNAKSKGSGAACAEHNAPSSSSSSSSSSKDLKNIADAIAPQPFNLDPPDHPEPKPKHKKKKPRTPKPTDSTPMPFLIPDLQAALEGIERVALGSVGGLAARLTQVIKDCGATAEDLPVLRSYLTANPPTWPPVIGWSHVSSKAYLADWFAQARAWKSGSTTSIIGEEKLRRECEADIEAEEESDIVVYRGKELTLDKFKRARREQLERDLVKLRGESRL